MPQDSTNRDAAETYLVSVSMVRPLRARVGDVIRIREGHATSPVAVWRRDGKEWKRVVAVREFDDGMRHALAAQQRDGVVVRLTSEQPVGHVTVQRLDGYALGMVVGQAEALHSLLRAALEEQECVIAALTQLASTRAQSQVRRDNVTKP